MCVDALEPPVAATRQPGATRRKPYGLFRGWVRSQKCVGSFPEHHLYAPGLDFLEKIVPKCRAQRFILFDALFGLRHVVVPFFCIMILAEPVFGGVGNLAQIPDKE